MFSVFSPRKIVTPLSVNEEELVIQSRHGKWEPSYITEPREGVLVYQHISARPIFRDYSNEEIRLLYYERNPPKRTLEVLAVSGTPLDNVREVANVSKEPEDLKHAEQNVVKSSFSSSAKPKKPEDVESLPEQQPGLPFSCSTKLEEEENLFQQNYNESHPTPRVRLPATTKNKLNPSALAKLQEDLAIAELQNQEYADIFGLHMADLERERELIAAERKKIAEEREDLKISTERVLKAKLDRLQTQQIQLLASDRSEARSKVLGSITDSEAAKLLDTHPVFVGVFERKVVAMRNTPFMSRAAAHSSNSQATSSSRKELCAAAVEAQRHDSEVTLDSDERAELESVLREMSKLENVEVPATNLSNASTHTAREASTTKSSQEDSQVPAYKQLTIFEPTTQSTQQIQVALKLPSRQLLQDPTQNLHQHAQQQEPPAIKHLTMSESMAHASQRTQQALEPTTIYLQEKKEFWRTSLFTGPNDPWNAGMKYGGNILDHILPFPAKRPRSPSSAAAPNAQHWAKRWKPMRGWADALPRAPAPTSTQARGASASAQAVCSVITKKVPLITKLEVRGVAESKESWDRRVSSWSDGLARPEVENGEDGSAAGGEQDEDEVRIILTAEEARNDLHERRRILTARLAEETLSQKNWAMREVQDGEDSEEGDDE